MPANRYFASDGIHLSMSGLKRVLNALDITVKLVVNYDVCVYSSQRPKWSTARSASYLPEEIYKYFQQKLKTDAKW